MKRQLRHVIALMLAVCLCLSGMSLVAFAESGAVKSEIVIARPEDSNNLDPVMQDGNVNIWIFNLVMEGLLQTTDDGAGIEPALAESYEVSEDGLTYTFHMKDGLVFSNGEPVLGEDLVWSYEYGMNSTDSVWSDLLSGIKSVEAPDDKTFIAHMTEASPVSEATFTLFNVLIGDKSYFEEVGAEGYAKKPIGTGAYKFDEWRQGEFLRVVKNDLYRDAASVKTQAIKFTVVPDDNTRVMQLQSGAVDMITFVPWNRMSELAADPNLKVETPASTEMRCMELNCVNGPTADPKVRKAIAMAINKTAMAKTVLFGYGTEADSFMSSSVVYYSKPETAKYDPEAAKALLAEAGYPDGLKIKLTTVAGNSNYETMATMAKEMLSQIGIDVTIELLEAGTHNAKRKALELEMFFGGWTNDIPDASQQCGYYCLPSMANCVHTGWKNETVIDLVEKAKVEMDTAKRADLYKQIQQLYADDVPTIPIYYCPFPVAMSAKVSGFAQTPLGNYRFNNLVAAQ